MSLVIRWTHQKSLMQGPRLTFSLEDIQRLQTSDDGVHGQYGSQQNSGDASNFEQ
jgi:hypothetical protein